MPIEDALSDIDAALTGKPVLPSMAAPQNGVDAALADLVKPADQLKAEVSPPKSQASSLPDSARFGITAGVRGLGGLVDFVTDPLAPLRRIISPDLERIEQSGRAQPGAAAGNAFFAGTGVPEYQPTTPGGRIGLAASEGLIGGAPFGLVPALLSAIGGGVGQGTHEVTGSERLATAASLLPGGLAPLVRGGTNFAAQQARNIVGPALSRSMREGAVGEQLRSAATDPLAFAQVLEPTTAPELVPGSRPTTYQLTGDQGVGQLERTQRNLSAAPFLERAQEQNAARVGALGQLAPENAAPGAVRDFLQQRLHEIGQEGDANVARAQSIAQRAFDQAGGQMTPEEMGAIQRSQLEAAKAATKQREGALWQAIDPEGKLTINAAPVGQEAGRILSEIPKTAKPPEGEEAAVLGLARLGGTAQSFQDFAALRGRLLQAIRDERINGQTPALRRMQQLRSAMDDAISETANKAAEADPAILSRLSQQVGDLYGQTNAATVPAGSGGGAGIGLTPSGMPQASPGILGTAGEAGGGSAGAAGGQGVPVPPRPQDLIQFLRERGGLRPDEGGELRAIDLHKKQGFARIINDNGMGLDDARELAVEAGYLHPDSDINDLLAALRRNEAGQPVFNDNDPAALAWREYERARQRGDFEGQPPLPGAPANFDAAAAARYRAAADATRERAATFNNQVVGPALQERGNEYRLLESRVPERFMGRAEGARAFIAAGGKPETLHDSLVMDLRRAATDPDGALNVSKYQSWLNRRSDALQLFPDLRDRLSNVASAQESVDSFAGAARQQRVYFEQSAARHFLNAEPMQAVRAALSGKNPVGDMKQLADLTAADPAAKAGLQRAVADYITTNFIGNTEAGTSGVGSVKSDAFQTFVNRNSDALGAVFSPEQVQSVRAIADDLQRSNRSIAGNKLPGQSNTPQDLALMRNRRLSLLRGYMIQGALTSAGALGGYLLGGIHGAVEGALGGGGAKVVMDKIRASGMEQTNQLLTQALLDPALARTLLMKATPQNRPFIAAKLRASLGRIAGPAASNEERARER